MPFHGKKKNQEIHANKNYISFKVLSKVGEV